MGDVDFDHASFAIRQQLALVTAWEGLGLVFPNEIGKPIERGNLVRRSFEPLLTKMEPRRGR